MLSTKRRSRLHKRSGDSRAAKHECDELKEELGLSQFRLLWTDKHRDAVRKLAVEEGCVQTRTYDTGWSDEKMCRGCNKEEARRSTYFPLFVMRESQKPDPRGFGEMESCTTSRLLSGSHGWTCYLLVKGWREEMKCLGPRSEGRRSEDVGLGGGEKELSPRQEPRRYRWIVGSLGPLCGCWEVTSWK